MSTRKPSSSEPSERIAALEADLAFYRRLVESSHDVVYSADANGVFTYVSPQVAGYGYAPEDLVGRSFIGVIHPEDRERTLADFRRTLETGEEFPTCFRLICKGGCVVEAEEFGSVLRDGDAVVGLTGVVRDITERKQAETEVRRLNRELERRVMERTADVEAAGKALRASEDRYRNVYDTAPLAFVLWDRECRILDWNRQAARMFGWTRDEVLGRNFLELIVVPYARATVEHLAASLLRGELPSHGINDNLTKSGKVITCEWNNSILRDPGGNIVGAISLALDITERRRSEAALRHSEERLQLLVNNANDLIFRFDLNRGYTFMSPSVKKLLGYSPQDFYNDPLLPVIITHPDDLPELDRILAALIDGAETSINFEARRFHKDGHMVHLEYRCTAVRDDNGIPLWIDGVARDITEHRRAEEALRESERRYRSIYEAIPDPVALYDPASRKLVAVNELLLQQYGYTEDELLQQDISILIPEYESEQFRELLRRNMEQPGPVRSPLHHHRRKDGSRFWVDVTATPIEIAGQALRLAMIRDVTESVRARERIERQVAILANVTDAVAVVDEGRVVSYWGPGAAHMFGCTEQEMLGQRGLDRLLRPDYAPEAVADEILSAVRQHKNWTRTRFPCRDKNGKDMWVAITASALEPKPDEPLRIMVVARDVTGEVQLQERLIRSERLAIIGTLASGVAHELNNLLGGLHGLADLAAGNEKLVPKLIDASRAVAERGGTIAGRLTTFARADEPAEDRKVDIPSIVSSVVTMMEPVLGRRNVRAEEHCKAVPPTWVNEGKMLQVLLNLFVNAYDSIGYDGVISVSVDHDADRDAIRIAVSDTGAGIRPEDVPRLFEPFFTTKREPGPDGAPSHLGLGLPESVSIVRGYGGTMDVESEPGRGATFRVTLPVRSAPTTPGRKAPAAARMPEKGTAMLVVDDDPLMRFWLTEYLESQGYEVVAVATGQEAVAACREGNFAYVFLDVLMPGEMDGPAAHREIQKLRPDIKLIVSTAFGKDSIPEDCIRAAHAVLQKPFGVDDIARAFAGEGSPD